MDVLKSNFDHWIEWIIVGQTAFRRGSYEWKSLKWIFYEMNVKRDIKLVVSRAPTKPPMHWSSLRILGRSKLNLVLPLHIRVNSFYFQPLLSHTRKIIVRARRKWTCMSQKILNRLLCYKFFVQTSHFSKFRVTNAIKIE